MVPMPCHCEVQDILARPLVKGKNHDAEYIEQTSDFCMNIYFCATSAITKKQNPSQTWLNQLECQYA